MSDDLRDELEALERQGWDALCEGSASDFYGRVMTSDGQMVLANGMAMNRDDVVRSLRGAPPWDGYEIADLRLVTTGEEGAALVYKGTARRSGSPEVVCIMSSVYVRVNGTWRLALYTQTPVAAPAG
jgi:hypothetical protein